MSDPDAPPPSPYGRAEPPVYGGPYGGSTAGPPPDNNLVWAILVTVLCCLPFGIVSIIAAAQVNAKWAGGDVAGAHESAAKARKWALIGAGVGVALVVLYVLGIVGLVVAATHSTTSTTY